MTQFLGADFKSIVYVTQLVQSIWSYVIFQGNNEIWSHKTGGHLRQV
jgi:hypothetical protein